MKNCVWHSRKADPENVLTFVCISWTIILNLIGAYVELVNSKYLNAFRLRRRVSKYTYRTQRKTDTKWKHKLNYIYEDNHRHGIVCLLFESICWSVVRWSSAFWLYIEIPSGFNRTIVTRPAVLRTMQNCGRMSIFCCFFFKL